MNDHVADPVGLIIAVRRPAVVLDVGAGHGTSLSWLIESAPPAVLLIAVDIATPAGGLPDRVRYVRADAVDFRSVTAAWRRSRRGPRCTTSLTRPPPCGSWHESWPRAARVAKIPFDIARCCLPSCPGHKRSG